MRKRYTVLGLSVVLALALSVPALGGPSNPIASVSASVKKTAQKALKRANQANNKAKRALTQANSAAGAANTAQNDAKKAQTSADGAQASANSAKGTADAALAAASAAQAAADKAEANANSRIKQANQVFGEATAVNTDTDKSASVTCPAGDTLGGGFFVGGAGNNSVTVTNSEHLFYANGWFVAAEAITGTPSWSLAAIAMCGTT